MEPVGRSSIVRYDLNSEDWIKWVILLYKMDIVTMSNKNFCKLAKGLDLIREALEENGS